MTSTHLPLRDRVMANLGSSLLHLKKEYKGEWTPEKGLALADYAYALVYGDRELDVNADAETRAEANHKICSAASTVLFELDKALPGKVNRKFVKSCFKFRNELERFGIELPGMVEIKRYAYFYELVAKYHDLDQRSAKAKARKRKAAAQPKRTPETAQVTGAAVTDVEYTAEMGPVMIEILGFSEGTLANAV